MAAWKKQRYHEQEEYASFKELLQVPVDDAQDIIANRFPIPRYVETEQGGSQVHWHSSLSSLDLLISHRNDQDKSAKLKVKIYR